MKIIDHRASVSEYPVTYKSVEFVRDTETGEKKLNRHGQYEMREIEEAHIQRKAKIRWLVLNDKDKSQNFMDTAEAVSTFGKKAFRHAKRKYAQQVRMDTMEPEQRAQYVRALNVERARRGQPELRHV